MLRYAQFERLWYALAEHACFAARLSVGIGGGATAGGAVGF